MNRFESRHRLLFAPIYWLSAFLAGLLLVVPLFAQAANGTFSSPQSVTIQNLPMGSLGEPVSTEEPFVSRDGKFLFFNTADHENHKDLHFAEMKSGGWVYRGEIGPNINTSKEVEGNPTMDSHRTFLYIDSGTNEC